LQAEASSSSELLSILYVVLSTPGVVARAWRRPRSN